MPLAEAISCYVADPSIGTAWGSLYVVAVDSAKGEKITRLELLVWKNCCGRILGEDIHRRECRQLHARVPALLLQCMCRVDKSVSGGLQPGRELNKTVVVERRRRSLLRSQMLVKPFRVDYSASEVKEGIMYRMAKHKMKYNRSTQL